MGDLNGCLLLGMDVSLGTGCEVSENGCKLASFVKMAEVLKPEIKLAPERSENMTG